MENIMNYKNALTLSLLAGILTVFGASAKLIPVSVAINKVPKTLNTYLQVQNLELSLKKRII
jgi:hypothetical protein